MKKTFLSIILALLAAIFYALNIPLSKLLLNGISPTMLAGLLYLGAGLGIGVFLPFSIKKDGKSNLLSKSDTLYIIGMIVLDIAAPILLMFGISKTSGSSAALLNNFEIVATALIALFIFKEKITPKLWIAIVLVTMASVILTYSGGEMTFSYGALFVLGAAVCWGFENNCTRKISNKNVYEIVTVKGLCCGISSIVIALIIGESFPVWRFFIYALLLGFVAYGLSIFFYIKAQNKLGAAKTSAFYAVNPFIGAVLSLIIFKDTLVWNFYVALGIMLIGTAFIIIDTIERQHTHLHTHVITHTHDGTTHTHVIEHEHKHSHFGKEDEHNHHHLKIKE